VQHLTNHLASSRSGHDDAANHFSDTRHSAAGLRATLWPCLHRDKLSQGHLVAILDHHLAHGQLRVAHAVKAQHQREAVAGGTNRGWFVDAQQLALLLDAIEHDVQKFAVGITLHQVYS
jgi:hypothetical protein